MTHDRFAILLSLACIGACADDAGGTANPASSGGHANNAGGGSAGTSGGTGGTGGASASGGLSGAGSGGVYDGHAVLIGETFVINSSSAAPSVPITGSRWTDIAFDSKNGVFLAAWSSLGSIYGRFISQDGALLGEPFVIPEALAPYSYPDHPRLAFSPETGSFLVVYREERGETPDPPPAHILVEMGRFVTYTSSAPALGTSFQISVGGDVNGTGTNPAVVYSATSQEFLVAYMAQGLFAQRVDTTGTLLGDVITIAPAGEWDTEPSISLDPETDQAYVVWHREIASPHEYRVLGRRVQLGTGALLDEPLVIHGPAPSAQHTPEVQFDPVLRRHLVVWSDYGDATSPARVAGRFVRPDNTLDGETFTISPQAAFYGGLGLAYNPYTKTFLSSFTHAPSGDADRVWGVHITGAGVVGTEIRLTTLEAITDFTRAAANPGRPEWLSIATIRYTTTLGQRVGLSP